MAGSNSNTHVAFNQAYFDQIMRTAAVEQMTKARAEKVFKLAHDTAPVDTGDYQRGLAVERHKSAHRDSFRVVGHDPKTLLVEAKTGHLARCLKAVGKQ